jgi:hypothetical protein
MSFVRVNHPPRLTECGPFPKLVGDRGDHTWHNLCLSNAGGNRASAVRGIERIKSAQEGKGEPMPINHGKDRQETLEAVLQALDRTHAAQGDDGLEAQLTDEARETLKLGVEALWEAKHGFEESFLLLCHVVWAVHE